MGIQLSSRLTACLEAVSPYLTLADIGTDHGYLPCAGVMSHNIKSAIAADIGIGPLNAAKQQIKRYDLEDKIETRLGPGLSVLKQEEVEAVVIAGMGGKLIVSILEDNMQLTRSFKRLILQPNIDADLVRACLLANCLHVTAENLILEDDKFYEVIVAQPAQHKQELSAKDIKFGKFLRIEKSEAFLLKYNKVLNKQLEIIAKLPNTHPRVKEIEVEISWLKEVLSR